MAAAVGCDFALIEIIHLLFNDCGVMKQRKWIRDNDNDGKGEEDVMMKRNRKKEYFFNEEGGGGRKESIK